MVHVALTFKGMESPAKRQKKNGQESSPLPACSLDFFFAKQNASVTQSTQSIEVVQASGSQTARDNGRQLADEDLARRLHDQWTKEDGIPEEQQPTIEARTPQSVLIRPANAASQNAGQNMGENAAEFADQQTTPWKTSTNKQDVLGLQSLASVEDTITLAIPLDENPLAFQPSNYVPQLQKHWAKEGGNASYALLTRCFVLVNSTQSRIKIVDTLVNCLRTITEGDPSSLLPAVWLATNSISPPYVSLELGLGGSAISKALKKVCGLDNAGLKTLYDKYGDAGDVAFEAMKRQ
jgi:DNA ligase-1